MNRPTRRLATAILIAFGVLGLIATWVQVVAADTYRLDPRNARFSLAQSGKERGLIVSADGVVLARSDPDPDTTGAYVRVYPEGRPVCPCGRIFEPPFRPAGPGTCLLLGTAVPARSDHLRPDLGDPGSGSAAAQPPDSPSMPSFRGSHTRRWGASGERSWP